MITADSPMYRSAVMISDLVEALVADGVTNDDLVRRIVVECSPVIVNHILFNEGQ